MDRDFIFQEEIIENDFSMGIRDNTCIMLFTSGHGTIYFGETPFEVGPGSFSWLLDYSTYRIAPFHDEPLKVLVGMADCYMYPYIIPEITSNFSTSLVKDVPLVYLSDQEFLNVKNLFNEAITEQEANKPYSMMMLSFYFLQLSALFKQYCINRAPSINEWEVPIHRGIMQEMGLSCVHNQSIEDYAERYNTTPAYINYVLRKLTGSNFYDALNELRVNFVKTMMLFENLPLDYIARCSGFVNDATFYRVFKQFTSLTPGEYRKKLRETHPRGMEDPGWSVAYYIATHYEEKLTVERVANALYISTNQVQNSIEKLFGLSFSKFVVECRILIAESLIRTTNFTISDITYETGFSSSRSLFRHFQNKYKLTPGEYRKRINNE